MDRNELLTRYSIANNSAAQPTIEAVDFGTPDLKDTIFVRKVSAGELDTFFSEGGDQETVRARYAVMLACKADGSPFFQATDVDAVANLQVEIVDPIVTAGQRFNKQLPDQKAALAKN